MKSCILFFVGLFITTTRTFVTVFNTPRNLCRNYFSKSEILSDDEIDKALNDLFYRQLSDEIAKGDKFSSVSLKRKSSAASAIQSKELVESPVTLVPNSALEIVYKNRIMFANYLSTKEFSNAVVLRLASGTVITVDVGQIISVWDTVADEAGPPIDPNSWAEVTTDALTILRNMSPRKSDLQEFWQLIRQRSSVVPVDSVDLGVYIFQENKFRRWMDPYNHVRNLDTTMLEEEEEEEEDIVAENIFRSKLNGHRYNGKRTETSSRSVSKTSSNSKTNNSKMKNGRILPSLDDYDRKRKYMNNVEDDTAIDVKVHVLTAAQRYTAALLLYSDTFHFRRRTTRFASLPPSKPPAEVSTSTIPGMKTKQDQMKKISNSSSKIVNKKNKNNKKNDDEGADLNIDCTATDGSVKEADGTLTVFVGNYRVLEEGVVNFKECDAFHAYYVQRVATASGAVDTISNCNINNNNNNSVVDRSDNRNASDSNINNNSSTCSSSNSDSNTHHTTTDETVATPRKPAASTTAVMPLAPTMFSSAFVISCITRYMRLLELYALGSSTYLQQLQLQRQSKQRQLQQQQQHNEDNFNTTDSQNLAAETSRLVIHRF